MNVIAVNSVIRIIAQKLFFTMFKCSVLPAHLFFLPIYRSKYLDLYDKVRSDNEKEKVSILDDIDFELELIRRDTINVSYIISLLRNLQDAKPADQEKQRKAILGILESETQLRSKRELIERFIANTFPDIPKGGDIGEEFETYWNEEKQKAIVELSGAEGLDLEGLQKIIGDYLFTEKTPMRDDVVGIIKKRPSLKQRRSVSERIISKIKAFVETFIDGVD